MTFAPENELEKAMQLAASEQSAHPAFYRLLLDSDLIVLGELVGSGMSLDAVENGGVRYHPLFTSPTRLDGLPTTRPHFRMRGRILFESTRGGAFVINPGSELGKTLSAEEIAWFLDAFRPGRGDLIVAQPKVYPTKLVKALCVLFTSRQLIRAAHLVYVAREGIDREAHPMIGLEAEGDVPRLAQEIIEIADNVTSGQPIEVVYLDTTGPLDPLQKHLLSLPAFYQRTLPKN